MTMTPQRLKVDRDEVFLEVHDGQVHRAGLSNLGAQGAARPSCLLFGTHTRLPNV